MTGLDAWIPEFKGTEKPTEINTMLCEDGRYHDPNDLKSYFVKREFDFFGIDRVALYGNLTCHSPGVNTVVKMVIP